MTKWRTGAIPMVAALAAAAMLAACNSAADDDPASEATTVEDELADDQTAPLDETVTLTIGSTYNLANGVVVVAHEMGFFEEENLDVQVEVISNSQDSMALLAQGRLDAVTGSISAGMLNSVASGLDVHVVSAISNISAVPGADGPAPSGVFVRKDLYDSGEVTEPADLAGRNVAIVGGMGASASYLVGLYAEQGGLTLADMTVKNLASPDSLAALTSGAVDAAFLTAPFSLEAVSSGVGVELGDAREVYGDQTQAALLFGPTLLEENPRAGVAFMRALKKAQDVMEGDYRQNPELVEALMRGAELTESQVMDTPLYNVDLVMNPATIENMQRMFLELGDLLTYSEPLSVEDILDTRFSRAAGIS